MKKLGIATIMITFLVAGALVILPFQEANAGVQVRSKSITKKIPLDDNPPNGCGDNVTVTFTAKKDLLLQEIHIDNYPTDEAGDGDPPDGCEVTSAPGDTPVTCDDSNYRILSMKIDDRDLRPGAMPLEMAEHNRLSIRPFLNWLFEAVHLPLKKGQVLTLTFDTCNDTNDVTIKVTFVWLGGNAKLE